MITQILETFCERCNYDLLICQHFAHLVCKDVTPEADWEKDSRRTAIIVFFMTQNLRDEPEAGEFLLLGLFKQKYDKGTKQQDEVHV